LLKAYIYITNFPVVAHELQALFFTLAGHITFMMQCSQCQSFILTLTTRQGEAYFMAVNHGALFSSVRQKKGTGTVGTWLCPWKLPLAA